jgi:Electron transfer DM13
VLFIIFKKTFEFMKRIFVMILMLAVLTSCSKEEEIKVTRPELNPDLSGATLLRQGTLQGINHTASGAVSIYQIDSSLFVVLDPFMSQSGPDLKVYLSKDVTASEYLRLGNLMAFSGPQTYPIPSGYSINNYTYVHIWCEKFSVEFARAEVK